jgi:hypothetical protein
VRSLQILVVDDDDADALMIEEALASETQATVERVHDGREALDYLRGEGTFSQPRRLGRRAGHRVELSAAGQRVRDQAFRS